MKKILKQLKINTKLIEALCDEIEFTKQLPYYTVFKADSEQKKELSELTVKLVKLHDQRLKIILDLEQALLTEKSELKKYLHDAKAA